MPGRCKKRIRTQIEPGEYKRAAALTYYVKAAAPFVSLFASLIMN